MKKKIFMSIAALLLLFAMAATASAVSVTRDLPDSSVMAGTNFDVSISPTGFFIVGTVTEVLPSGYTYVAGSATPVDDATYNSATGELALVVDAGTSTVTYSVTAGTATDTFTGTYATIDASADPVTGAVTGDTTVTIGDAPTVSVTRDLPDSSVMAGTNFDVSISPTGFFIVGTVTEVLPSGYTYVAGSATPVDDATYNSATGELALVVDAGTSTVTYSVTAGTATDTFTGTYATIDASADPVTGAVTGDTTVTIGVPDDDPVVILIYPTDGEELNGEVTLNASAIADPDGSIVSVLFYHSGDDGSTWTEIGTGAASGIYYTCAWDTKTVDNGDYKVKAVAEDDLTGTGAGEDESDVSIDNGFCLQLEAGLNFVSIPKTLVDSPKDATTVFDVDYYSGEFCLYYDASAGSFDLDADVKPCRGFLVYKNAAKTVCVDFDDAAPAPSQQLYVGWNMIGHVKTVAMPINDGTNADFVSITGLEEPEGNLLFRLMATYTGTGWSEYPGSLTDATPGAGYWIYMNHNVTMSGGFE